MEGDWSSREGRLPRLDRDGRTLSDSDYCLPSPPERDLSTIHLSQVSLDGGYGGDVSSEAGSSEVFHHCQQPSYAHSEGYYSYVSSTDSITPFIDRLKRELEFTEVQENSSSASSHGGTSVKWEESDTDTFVAPRERSAVKADCESVWHFRGSSGDLVTPSSRPSLANASSRLASPPLSSSDSARASYQSRVPQFHNATYECVNIDHSSRLSTQSHAVNSHPTGVTHTSRPQINHGCTTTNSSKATRLPANHCRSCDVAYSGRIPPTLNLEPTDVTYPTRLHSNGSACDGPGADRLQQSNNANREHLNSRPNKAQPQISNSSRIHHLHSSNIESINSSSGRLYSYDSTNHLSRTNSNQNESLHHSSRLSSNHVDSKIHSSRQQSKHSDSNSLLHSNHIDSSNLANRTHQTDNPLIKTKEAHNSNHGDSSNHSTRVHPVINDSSNHCIPKIFNVGEPTHLTRLHSNHCDSSSSNSIRMQSSHNDPSVLNSSRIYSGRSSSSDFLNLSHSSRDHNLHLSTSDAINLDHSSRHTAKPGSESSSVNHPLRIHCHSSSHGTNSETSATHPSRIHSHSSVSSESSNSTHSSRVNSHSSLSINSDISNISHPSRTHSNHIVNSDNVSSTHPSRVLNTQNHTASTDSGIPNHQNKNHSHSVNESANSNLPSRIHSNSSDPNTSNNQSRNHSHSSLNDLTTPHHTSRLHSHPSTTSEALNTSLSTRIYTHSSHSISNESANIARSSRVPPPQRHLSQSVLYLSADHRKLFPISTYQPEPPRVVGAVSVSERVVELENRLGGLKALQKKALLSFYQRHQASAPAPPPPPRRASSASDYLQLKGCIESSSTVSGSSQTSNGVKESSSASSCGSSTSSSNSLLKDARQLHRSCGSLSGISGPVIVGRSISVDDWVPARPPKGAHLRPAAPRPPSPEVPQAASRQPISTSSSNQLSSLSNMPTSTSQSPEKISGNHRLNPPAEAVRSTVHRNQTRPASPEPPPPPPSPPQHYSDEPLPPPPDPEDLSPLPPALPSRHPSPGPQVPLNQDTTQQTQTSELKVPADLSTKQTYSENIPVNTTSLDLKPQKLSDIIPNSVSNDKSQHGIQTSTPLVDKMVKSQNGVGLAHSNLIENNNKTEKSIVAGSGKNELSQRISPSNNRNSKLTTDSKAHFKTICPETSFQPLSNIQPSTNSKSDSLSPRTSPALSSGKTSPQKHCSSGLISNVDSSKNSCSNDSDSASEQLSDALQLNHCTVDHSKDELVQKSPSKVLTRNSSKDKLSQVITSEKPVKIDEAQEESPSKDMKKLLRKTSFRCSERIQQSITTLQNSIRSSSPQKFQESQKELLYRDLLSKDILKDILPKDPVLKDILSDEIVTKDIPIQDSCKQTFPIESVSKDVVASDLLSKESIANDILSKAVLNADKYVKDLLAKDILSQEAASKEISKNVLSEDRWASTLISSEASPSKLSLSLTRLDHIDFTEKLISSFTSRKCGVDDKEDSISDCDLEKSCSMAQPEANMSVGTLQQKKEELITRLSRKLSVLRAEAAAVAEETSTNEELGEAVVERVASAWGSREAARLRSHVADLGRLTALLLTLTTRLARADNALLALSSSQPDKGVLEAKRDRLAGQLEEARRLKEKVDRRNEAVTSKLRERLTSEEFSDFMHFVSLKSKLLLDSREIADKIKLGEEQLQALQMTLSAVT